jgi:hypothetical protein
MPLMISTGFHRPIAFVSRYKKLLHLSPMWQIGETPDEHLGKPLADASTEELNAALQRLPTRWQLNALAGALLAERLERTPKPTLKDLATATGLPLGTVWLRIDAHKHPKRKTGGQP